MNLNKTTKLDIILFIIMDLSIFLLIIFCFIKIDLLITICGIIIFIILLYFLILNTYRFIKYGKRQ